jgi:hypothetical protein
MALRGSKIHLIPHYVLASTPWILTPWNASFLAAKKGSICNLALESSWIFKQGRPPDCRLLFIFTSIILKIHIVSSEPASMLLLLCRRVNKE